MSQSGHPVDPELAALVVGDLGYLSRSWTQPITEYSIKHESAVLRRLLVDDGGLLQRYRRQLGLRGEPRIRAIAFREALGMDYTDVTVAMAGGAMVEGAVLGPAVVCTRELPPAPEITFPTREYVLGDYLSGPCMVAGGLAVSRRQLIKYVANKLGGVHYDTGRASQSAKRGSDERLFEALDVNRSTALVLGVDMAHLELLCIGQHLLRCPDIASLMPEGDRFTMELPDLDQVMNWVLAGSASGSFSTAPTNSASG